MVNYDYCVIYYVDFWMENESSRSFFLEQYPFHSQRRFQHMHLVIGMYHSTVPAIQKQAWRREGKKKARP